MGRKISQFPAATTINEADVLAGVQGTSNRKFSFGLIKGWLQSVFVPVTRTINNIALSSDITLAPSDIGAVPTSREVNGKALSSDITLDASDVGAATPSQVGSIALSSSWSGSGPYSQTVTVTGATVTANSKVDIQLTATQIASLISAGVTGLVIENNAGTLTAWAVGASPSAMTVQCTVEETA